MFTLGKLLGSGAMGEVYCATSDDTRQERVAAKVFTFASDQQTSYESFCDIVAKEIYMHRLAKKAAASYCPALYQVDYNAATGSCTMFMELCKETLKQKQPVQNIRVATSISQHLFQGLAWLHEHNIVHRDIKPDNIMIDYNDSVKICDYGLACVLDNHGSNPRRRLSDYVVTRWYRAPELVLKNRQETLFSPRRYTAAVDTWAAGIVVLELLRGRCITQSLRGRHHHTIFAALGPPTQKEHDYLSKKFCVPASHKRNALHFRYALISAFVQRSDCDALCNVILKTLDFNDQRRISAAKAALMIGRALRRVP